MIKMKRQMFYLKLFFIFAMTIFLASGVFALGVTPGRTTFNFEPGSEKSFSFFILNSEDKDFGVSIIVEGDLKNYLTLSENSFNMYSDEPDKKIQANLSLPFWLSPGLHVLKIFVLEKNSEEGGSTKLGAVVGVVTEVNVFVPYPGKYLDVGINVVGPNENGGIDFVIPVVNRGSENISNASAVLEVFDLKGSKIETINTNHVGVPQSQRRELVGRLLDEIPLGKYNLSASIFYDGNVLKFNRLFVVGEPILDLRELRVSEFRLGGIAEFNMLVENNWNEPIKNAYAKMKIYGANGGVLAEFSSPIQDVPALGSAVFTSYWDSVGVQKAVYDSAVSLVYEEKTSEKRFKLDVQDNQINIIGVSYVISKGEKIAIDIGGIILLLVSAIVILVVVNALWFLLLRKKILGSGGKKR